MSKKIDDAIGRIKALECPTGEVENRIAGILEDYGVANKNEVEVKRYEGIKINGAEEFCAKIPGEAIGIVVSEPMASILAGALQKRELQDLWKAECSFGSWEFIDVPEPRPAAV